MKTALTILLSLVLLVPANGADDPLDVALKDIATYEFGKGDGPNKTIADAVLAAAADKEPAKKLALEQRILKALDGPLTRDAKDFLIRQLFISSSPASIAKLEALLADEQIGHLARYALGRMQYVEALQALHRALAKTSGKAQAGVINSLASRRYNEALPDITKLVASPDPLVSKAAIAAVAELGGDPMTLESARASGSAEIRLAVDQALLALADRLAASNQQPQAAELYKKLYGTDRPKAVRAGALRGLVATGGHEVSALLVEAIKGKDELIAASAIGYSRNVKDASFSKTLVDLMPSMNGGLQESAIRALGDRGDEAAISAVNAAINSDKANVRTAALDVLGNVGTPAAVPVLVKAAAGTNADDQRAARESLLRLKGDAVNAAIVDAIKSAEGKPKSELVRALVGRKAAKADQLFALAQDADSGVRREAIMGLGQVANDAELTQLVGIAVKPKDNGDRGAVEEAVASASRRLGDPKRRTALLLETFASAPADAKPSIIRLFKSVASPDALDAVRKSLKDSDKTIVDAALRTLSDWPDASPANDLLAFAKDAPTPTQKVLALRGFVRQAGQSDKPVALLKQAMPLAERPDEKKLILGGLGNQNSLDALKLAQSWFKEEVIQAEAAQAMMNIAKKLKGKDAEKATEAVKEIAASAKDPKVKKQAEDLLKGGKK